MKPAAGAVRRSRRGSAGALVVAALLWAQAACDRGDLGSGGAAGASPASGEARPGTAAAARGGEIEEIRKARAALATAGIPLYPGAQGLDSTEFEANTAPFISVDFYVLDPPERVAAFYDRALEDRVARRDTTVQPGVVRYEFERMYSGLEVRPWDASGADSSALIGHFDRREKLGVTTAELDAYGKLLARARTHVVVNVPRPEPEGATS